ncbi:hypothetical protein LCGC14_0791180 [marine sediment metagenome]|uniref:Uncharacterized protein n=1 Tax=marine sediment metagenome TaxID=412755 RepID=A0A0F9SCF8_9ZZZZ
MDNKDSKVIMFDSNEAAQYRTNLSGWVSGNGRYWGEDERAARYDGCTHRLCEDCGGPTEKGWLVCKECRYIRDEARYKSMPKEEWNEKGMLYSDALDKYFSSWDEIEDYCEGEEVGIDKLMLIICEPNYLPLLSDDYGCDELVEDGELPDDAIQAIEDFNKVIKAVGAVSWMPGKKAVIIGKE